MSILPGKIRAVLWPQSRTRRIAQLAGAGFIAAATAVALIIRTYTATPCEVFTSEPERSPVSFAGRWSPEQQTFVTEYYLDLRNNQPRPIESLTYPRDSVGADQLVDTYAKAASGRATASLVPASNSHVSVCLEFAVSKTYHRVSLYHPFPGGPWAIDTTITLKESHSGCPQAGN